MDNNKKRYVYLDKFIDYQQLMKEELRKLKLSNNLLLVTSLVLIVTTSFILHKLLG